MDFSNTPANRQGQVSCQTISPMKPDPSFCKEAGGPLTPFIIEGLAPYSQACTLSSTNNRIKKWAEDLNRYFSKEDRRVHKKMLNITNHQEITIQNHFPPLRMSCFSHVQFFVIPSTVAHQAPLPKQLLSKRQEMLAKMWKKGNAYWQ